MRRKAIIIMPDAKPLPVTICFVTPNDLKLQMPACSITEVGIVCKHVLGHGKDAGLAVKLNFVR